METYCPQQNQSPNTAAPHREPRSAVAPPQLCVPIRNRDDMNLSEHMFIRLSFRVGPHLRPLFWLILSSRCCKIWWVKRWRRMKASMPRGCSRTVETSQCQFIKWSASPYTILSISAGAREEQNQDHDPPHSDLFLFPDESGNLTQDSSPTYPVLHSPLITPVPNLAQEADDFCILETPGSSREVRTATFLDSLQRESVSSVLSYLPSTGSWSGTSGKAAYFRSCGNQRWSFQSALMWEWLQPRSPELSHPRSALLHQGDLCCLAPLRRERLQERSFYRLSFSKSWVSQYLFRWACLNEL